MGAKPFFSLPILRRSAALMAAGAFAWALSSCISDGPNKTGSDYLAQHGVLLQDPLFHVALQGVPVDTFWTTDAEPSHLGDTIILAGSAGDFSAEARFAFQISDTNFIHRASADDSSTFKLSLGLPLSPIGRDALKATVAQDTAHPIDSVPFEVRSWEKIDSGLSEDQWADTLNVLNNRYLVRNDTVAVLTGLKPVLDTVFLKVRTAYAQDSLPQARPLPHLFAQLLRKTGNKHLIQFRLSRISLSPADTGAAMLRLGGQMGDGVDFRYGPLLLFGAYPDINSSVPTENRIQALFVGSRRGVNYSLRYDGPAENIVTGKVRGLHVILDRKTLLDRIDSALKKDGKPLQAHPAGGNFDLSYFVPFAKMTLPLGQTRLEGSFPLDIKMVTNVDSLLGDTLTGALRVDTVKDGTARILWHTYEIGNPENIQDDVSLAYAAYEDTLAKDLRRVVLKFSKDSVRNDTVYLRVGETKQRNTSLQGYGNSYLAISLEAGPENLIVRSYLTVRQRPEIDPNEYRDPATGETITDLARRVDKFLQPGATEFSLRATNGFQRLLNRVGSNGNILQDFQFLPSAQAAVDPKVPSGADTLPAVVNYPVLSVVPPALNGNKLTVDVELYLFPLKAR